MVWRKNPLSYQVVINLFNTIHVDGFMNYYCGSLKSKVPTHFVLRAQSPSRRALLPRTYDESPLKAQECGRGRSHAQHLTKRLKKRTNSVQEQYKWENCQHHNVEPNAWQAHTPYHAIQLFPTTLTYRLIGQYNYSKQGKTDM